MMVLYYLSIVFWTTYVNQSSPSREDGSVTSLLMPMSSLTSESLMGTNKLTSWWLTLVNNLPPQIYPPLRSYPTSWKYWWAQNQPTMGKSFRSPVSWHNQERVWSFGTPPTLDFIKTMAKSATSQRRPAIWTPLTYFINADANQKLDAIIKI